MHLLGQYSEILKILKRLGWKNVFTVLLHRVLLRVGYYSFRLPIEKVVQDEPFWIAGDRNSISASQVADQLARYAKARGDELVAGIFRTFEDVKVSEGEHPTWFKGSYVLTNRYHFSRIKLNVIPGDDVKLCWDLSRFKWATLLAVAAVSSKADIFSRKLYLHRLENLMADWISENNYYSGVNWACGQEVSIRGLHLMLTTITLAQHLCFSPSPFLLKLLEACYRRVRLTIGYSLAQNNNHSLTESLFLYYCPKFLERFGARKVGTREMYKNHQRLSKVLRQLIQSDGSFAMYSINYHRAVCDIVSFGGRIDQYLDIGFWKEDSIRHRLVAMHEFLNSIIEPVSGSAPNIGHNDGSLHCIQYVPYAQFRPSLIFMSGVFDLPVPHKWHHFQHEQWLFGAAVSFVSSLPERARLHDDFGILVVNEGRYTAYLKYPRARFRPQQVDFLHLDLWVDGVNILPDAGTFSYNPSLRMKFFEFDGATAHNAPALLDQEFIRRKGRFLYADWPEAKIDFQFDDKTAFFSASCTNSSGIMIVRNISFASNQITISDRVHGNAKWGVVFGLPSVTAQSTLSLPRDISVTTSCRLRFSFDYDFEWRSGGRSLRYLDFSPIFRLFAIPKSRTDSVEAIIVFSDSTQ